MKEPTVNDSSVAAVSDSDVATDEGSTVNNDNVAFSRGNNSETRDKNKTKSNKALPNSIDFSLSFEKSSIINYKLINNKEFSFSKNFPFLMTSWSDTIGFGTGFAIIKSSNNTTPESWLKKDYSTTLYYSGGGTTSGPFTIKIHCKVAEVTSTDSSSIECTGINYKAKYTVIKIYKNILIERVELDNTIKIYNYSDRSKGTIKTIKTR